MLLRKQSCIMEWLHIFFTALGSVVALFLLTKLMGNKQMSQLSMFDYINGITIGSIAAEMATALEDDFTKPLVAMTVYGLLSVLISVLSCKSLRLRRFFVGESVVLVNNGKIYNKNLMKSRIDLDDLLTQCRNCGYFNLADIQSAVLETNGKISFLPKSERRSVVPEDLNLTPPPEYLVTNVIMDGALLRGNLRSTGNNEEWLHKQLESQGVKNIHEVFLATCDRNNRLTVYLKNDITSRRDIFN